MTDPKPRPTIDDPQQALPPPRQGTTLIWLAFALGLVGSLLTIFQFFRSSDDPPSGIWFAVGISLPMIALLLVLGIVVTQFGREQRRGLNQHDQLVERMVGELREASERFAESTDRLVSEVEVSHRYEELVRVVNETAHSLASDATEAGEQPINDVELTRYLKRTCREVADAFTKALGFEVRLCVKQVCEADQGSEHRVYAKTICRSKGRSGDPKGILHWLPENTDFWELFQGEKEYWFCPDVHALGGRYRNTSTSYAYRSVITWPITSRMAGTPTGDDGATSPIVAFLCLDSEEVDVFEESKHVHLGWPIADAMAKAYEAHYLTFGEAPEGQ